MKPLRGTRHYEVEIDDYDRCPGQADYERCYRTKHKAAKLCNACQMRQARLIELERRAARERRKVAEMLARQRLDEGRKFLIEPGDGMDMIEFLVAADEAMREAIRIVKERNGQ